MRSPRVVHNPRAMGSRPLPDNSATFAVVTKLLPATMACTIVGEMFRIARERYPTIRRRDSCHWVLHFEPPLLSRYSAIGEGRGEVPTGCAQSACDGLTPVA